jgi:phospholipase C
MTDKSKPTPPNGFTRRRILGTAAAGGAAIAGGAWASGMLGEGDSGLGDVFTPSDALPANVRARLAEQAAGTAAAGSIGDVKHIVLLMMENRSFDHYFGMLPGVKGFSDPDAITLSTGRSVFHQPYAGNADGYLLPYHLDTTTTNANWIASTAHNWRVQHESWNNGAMNNWLPAHAVFDAGREPQVMGYFTRQDIPFHYALADAFTICDRYHCSVMGPTEPNRLMWETGNIDPDGAYEGPILGQENPVKTWPTYAEQLTNAGVSWRCYHLSGGMKSVTNNFANFKNAAATSPLKKNTAVVAADRFKNDCLNDTLPTVSWLFPPAGANEHPSEVAAGGAQFSPAAGAKFISDTIDAIAANPAVWAKTVFILAYDENDGFFDHVVPPTPPAGAVAEFVNRDSSVSGIHGNGWPVGAGFRVPCIIVSPWTTGGYVCSQPFDHTSCNRFIEAVTGVKTRFISPWRRATFGNLTSAFRFANAALFSASLPDADAALALAQTQKTLPGPVPPATQSAPVQAPGTRPSVP